MSPQKTLHILPPHVIYGALLQIVEIRILKTQIPINKEMCKDAGLDKSHLS